MKKIFKDHYGRYVRNIVINSAVNALILSSSVLLVLSTVFWILAFKGLAIELLVFFGVFSLSFIFFFLLKRPNEHDFAKKLDELGLEERVITMNQYKDDNSLMARIQRANACKAIDSLDKKALKVGLATAVLVIAITVTTLAIGTTTVQALAENDKIPSGGEVIGTVTPTEENIYKVEFVCIGDGFANGDLFQFVKSGESTTVIIAEAIPGNYFAWWQIGEPMYGDYFGDSYDNQQTKDDLLSSIFDLMNGNKPTSSGLNETNKDTSSTTSKKPIPPLFMDGKTAGTNSEIVIDKVDKDMIISLVFFEMPENGEPKPGEEGDPENMQNQPQTDPSNSNNNSNNDPSDQPSDNNNGNGASSPNHQVIDGATDYGSDIYDNAYDDAVNDMNNNNQMTDEEKEIIHDYFDNIEK